MDVTNALIIPEKVGFHGMYLCMSGYYVVHSFFGNRHIVIRLGWMGG